MPDAFTPAGKAETSAKIAGLVLRLYALETGASGHAEDDELLLSDLLTDLMHYCTHHGDVDFAQALARAEHHHACEAD